MQKRKNINLLFRFLSKSATPLKIIPSILLFLLLFAALLTPLNAALSPARDLTGTWQSALSEKYYEMDPSDPNTRMNDVSVTYTMIITQSGNSINIVLNVEESSWVTDSAYWNEYGMSGVPPVGFNQIGLSGTVSSASFAADEQGASTGNAEHLAGTFTTDIITATLTGPYETTDTNGLIVLRSGSSATMPPTATSAPTPTPTPAPALPTSDNLGSVSLVQGSAWFADTGAAVTTQSTVGTGAEIKTGSDSNTIVGFNYPDQVGTVYLGANSDAGWVYIEPQTDPITGNTSYAVVPPPSGSFQYSEGIDPCEFGQAGLQLSIEVGIGLGVMLVTGAPLSLGGALVVEGTILLGTGIAYIHEQFSPQEGTYDVRPVQVPQGLVMGNGTDDYVVTVSNESTTIQVIDGSVIFVDQYTNNTITVQANQMLMLPSGVPTGFSNLDLQSHLSAYDASSINQWWIPTATAAPLIATASPTNPVTNPATSNNSNLLFQPNFLAPLIMVIAFVLAGIFLTVRRKQTRKPRISSKKTADQSGPQQITNEPQKPTMQTTETIPPPPNELNTTQSKAVFCPNCGNQLRNASKFCPSCGSDISQWFTNAKK